MFYLFLLTTLLFVTVSLLPLFPSNHWVVRGWEFPRVQIASLLFVNICAILLFQDYDTGLLVLLWSNIGCLIWQLKWILPYTGFVSPEVEKVMSPPNRQLRILTANVLMENTQTDKLIELVNEYRPDVFVTLETNQWWQEQLSQLHGQFPYRVPVPLENLYGMHVYSKLPLCDVQVCELIEEGVPSVACKLEVEGAEAINAFFLHPAPPSPTENEHATERDHELNLVANRIKNLNGPVIVTGDLNDVAWSPTTLAFRKSTGLKDPRIGRGMFNTFHAEYRFVRWPLDHIFHSNHFKLVEIKRLSYIGSDHFPLFTVLAY
ncbi:endonuclease/exonuclease/phosphatase family protein [Aliiglaciecola litoralis]|uniref:Endonuclease/exonuclease/phosphatase family protein n=1 Tax=Aliiglaciecola litoralis TaxID=582857 RepID=A0ABN1LEC3_9ALTE